jgi:hypothetical protein
MYKTQIKIDNEYKLFQARTQSALLLKVAKALGGSGGTSQRHGVSLDGREEYYSLTVTRRNRKYRSFDVLAVLQVYIES